MSKKMSEKRKAQQRMCAKRRYQHIKNDPALLALEQEKRRIKYTKRKTEGKHKTITEQSAREQREQRKRWNENSKSLKCVAAGTHTLNEATNLALKSSNTLVTDFEQINRYRLRKRAKEDTKPACEEVIAEARMDADQPAGAFHQHSRSVKGVIRKIRQNESKKRQVLTNIIIEYKKTIDTQRKIIQRLNKKLKVQQAVTDYCMPKSRLPKSRTAVSSLCDQPVQMWHVESVIQFYTDDANSFISGMKKEYVIRNNVKMQKRYLNAPLKVLYHKFLSQVGVILSFPNFCRLRPFWTVLPKPASQDPSICFRHTNMGLLVRCLHVAGVVHVKNCDQLLAELCCDSMNLVCLSRTCDECSSNRLLYFNVSSNNVSFYEWRQTIKEVTVLNGTKKEQVLTQKSRRTLDITAAIKKLEADLVPFYRHVHTVVFQRYAIESLKQDLTFQEACVNLDCSQNFNLKFAAGIQPFNSGGSCEGISLHTSVSYTHNFTSGYVTSIPMGTVGACLRHDTPALWAHLVPVIQHVIKINPFIDTLHVCSRSSQYRNKYMFFVISQIRKDFPQIVKITWNYSEPGHGKVSAGVGAVLKRAADRVVLFNKTIGSCDQFYDTLMRTVKNVTIKKVDELDIIAKEILIPVNLDPFDSTHSVRQVLWDIHFPRTVMRKLSCFECIADIQCIHGYDLGWVSNENDNI